MPFQPDIHHRRSIRMKSADYTTPGAYYVTICTKDRRQLLGYIAEGACVLSQAGEIVRSVWMSVAGGDPNLELDVFTIMPDHFHAIIHIIQRRDEYQVGAKHSPLGYTDDPGEMAANASPNTRDSADRPCGTTAGSLGSVIQTFKSVTARRIGAVCKDIGQVWQRNYYDRIIRNEHELNCVRQYIENNPKCVDDEQ